MAVINVPKESLVTEPHPNAIPPKATSVKALIHNNMTVTGTANDDTANMLLDTGSATSIISREYLVKIGHDHDILPSPYNVISLNGANESIIGITPITLTLGEFQTDLKMHIVKHTIRPIIVGKDFISAHVIPINVLDNTLTLQATQANSPNIVFNNNHTQSASTTVLNNEKRCTMPATSLTPKTLHDTPPVSTVDPPHASHTNLHPIKPNPDVIAQNTVNMPFDTTKLVSHTDVRNEDKIPTHRNLPPDTSPENTTELTKVVPPTFAPKRQRYSLFQILQLILLFIPFFFLLPDSSLPSLATLNKDKLVAVLKNSASFLLSMGTELIRVISNVISPLGRHNQIIVGIFVNLLNNFLFLQSSYQYKTTDLKIHGPLPNIPTPPFF